MKKLLCALALLPALCFAQNNNTITAVPPIDESKFSLGIQGSFGHAFITPYKDYAFHSSWGAGFSAVYSPWKHWAIGLDATYSSEGAALSGTDLYTTRLDYLRIPVKAIYFFNDYGRDFRPKIMLGPTMGILVNDMNNVNAPSFDYGATISAGFNYRLMRAVWLTADVSYYQGFKDVYPQYIDNEWNGNVRLNLGLSFGF